MRLLRTGMAWLLIVGLSAPAFARDVAPKPDGTVSSTDTSARPLARTGDLRASIAKAVDAAEQASSDAQSISKGYLWAGTALFVGGMTVGLYAFLNNRNGEFPEFGEATATNKPLGAAGLITAFVGGTVLFLGVRRARRAPSLTFGPHGLTVSKQITW